MVQGAVVLVEPVQAAVPVDDGVGILDVMAMPVATMARSPEPATQFTEGSAGVSIAEAMPVGTSKSPMIGLVPGGLGLAIMDVSNVNRPEKITLVDTGVATRNAGGEVVVNGKTWYYGGGTGLAVIDGSTPTVPKVVKRVSTKVGTGRGGMGLAMDPVRGLLYCAGGLGLTILDIKAPEEPIILKSAVSTNVLTASAAGSVVVASTSFIFVGGSNGLAVMDVTDPTKPKRVTKLITGVATDSSLTLALHGTMLLAAGGRGLAVYDVRNPRTPVRMRKINTGVANSDGSPGVAISRDTGLVFVVGGWGGMAIFNPRDHFRRLSKTETGVLDLGQRASVSIWGSHAFIAGPKGLAIFNVGDPTRPVRLCKVETGALCYTPNERR